VTVSGGFPEKLECEILGLNPQGMDTNIPKENSEYSSYIPWNNEQQSSQSIGHRTPSPDPSDPISVISLTSGHSHNLGHLSFHQGWKTPADTFCLIVSTPIDLGIAVLLVVVAFVHSFVLSST